MRSITADSNMEILLRERRISCNKQDSKEFTKFIKEKRKELIGSSGKKGLPTRELAERVGIDYEMFRKILNMNKATKKRDCIIAICATLKLDSEETDKALELYQYMSRLDTENPRDDLLIDILEEQLSNYLTIPEINQRLVRNGLPELDIIDHRTSTKPVSEKDSAPFKLLEKQVRIFSNDLLLGDQYDSLETEYSVDRYHCVGEMWLDDLKEKKIYHLTVDRGNKYHMEVHGNSFFDIKSYKTVEDAGAFRVYYLELGAMVKCELKKLYTVLNDTRNYQARLGAGIQNDSLHVYAETFNYVIPELNEYYLFEYRNGEAILSVFHSSEFMKCYLGTEEYALIYGNRRNVPVAQYRSIEEILSNDDADVHISRYLLKSRSRFFEDLKKQADSLISDIKTHKRHIRNLDLIYDDKDRVCEFFGVEKEFKCTIDGECGDIMSAGEKSAEFRFADCGTVQISLEDLYKAFELGCSNINEICRIKKKLGSIEKILE